MRGNRCWPEKSAAAQQPRKAIGRSRQSCVLIKISRVEEYAIAIRLYYMILFIRAINPDAIFRR